MNPLSLLGGHETDRHMENQALLSTTQMYATFIQSTIHIACGFIGSISARGKLPAGNYNYPVTPLLILIRNLGLATL